MKKLVLFGWMSAVAALLLVGCDKEPPAPTFEDAFQVTVPPPPPPGSDKDYAPPPVPKDPIQAAAHQASLLAQQKNYEAAYIQLEKLNSLQGLNGLQMRALKLKRNEINLQLAQDLDAGGAKARTAARKIDRMNRDRNARTGAR